MVKSPGTRSWLAEASLASVGALTGAMVVIRVALVPFWRELPPDEFRRWFRRHASRIEAVMIPLGVTSALSTVSAALAPSGRGRRVDRALAGAATVGVVMTTLRVNEPANARFIHDELTDLETSDLLNRWMHWHNLRVGLGFVASLAAARGLQ